MIEYTTSRKGNIILVVDGHNFHKKKVRKNRVYWECKYQQSLKCPVRASQDAKTNRLRMNDKSHNHS